MFKCKECGTEYDIKPDFCDCGNDTFEEIAGVVNKEEDVVKPQVVIDDTPTNSSNTYNNYGSIPKGFNPVSMTIFLLCIVAALVIFLFVGNPKAETPDTNVQKKAEDNAKLQNIPLIDSIWNNSTVGIINNEKTKKQTYHVAQTPQPEQKPVTQTVQQPVAQPQQTTKAQPPQPKTNTSTSNQNQSIAAKIKQNMGLSQQKQNTNTQVPKTNNTTTTKPQQKTTTATNTATPKPNIPKNTQAIANGQPYTNSVVSTTKTPNTTTQKPQSTTTQKTQTTTQQTSQAQTTTKSTTTAATQNQTQKNTTVANTQVSTNLRPKATVDTQALKKELDNYKVGLRNTIGRKIDFANVIGDGDCTVSFKIATNGKLTNRSFSKQSSNVTLNDAVYSAVMSTPSYNPPPTGYNNETMNLQIKFYNGNFDISLN